MTPRVSQTLRSMLARIQKKDVQFVKELTEAGKLTPVMDRVYPLSKVPEAIRYWEDGHTRGKVVITLEAV